MVSGINRSAAHAGTLTVNRVAQFGQSEIIKDMVTVIVKDAQVIRLFQVSHNDIEPLAVCFPDQPFGHLIGDKFFNSFLGQFGYQSRIIEFTVSGQNQNGAGSGKEDCCSHPIHPWVEVIDYLEAAIGSDAESIDASGLHPEKGHVGSDYRC